MSRAKTRRSPQEKKALSYARDGRNLYGENHKAARKAIPLRKAKARRAVRRAGKIALRDLGPEMETPAPPGRPRWAKCPDLPLGAALEYGAFGDCRRETPQPFDPSSDWNDTVSVQQRRRLAGRLAKLRDR